jgi:amidohydrolase
LVSRECNPHTPLVVSVGRICGGHVYNVIPDRVEMRGTVRTYDPNLRNAMQERIERVVRGTTEAAGASYEMTYSYRYPSLSNDPSMAALVKDVAVQVVGEELAVAHNVDLVGEDMSFFFERVPGCYFFVGVRNPDKDCIHPHHSPRFNMDEDALAIGVEILVRSVERFLSEEPR